MADDVILGAGNNATPPASTVIATDDVGDVHYQRVKLTMGADGAADMDLDSGPQAKANCAPVVLATDQIDDITEAVTIVEFPHHEAHEGDAYMAHTVDIAMANNDYIGIVFTTPTSTTARMHMLASFSSKAMVHLDIIRGPSISGGTALTAFNRAEFSTNTSAAANMKSYDSTAGDAITGGTTIHPIYAFAGKQAGNERREDDEIILKSNTVYGFKLIADEASNAGEIQLSWYEHADSN